MGAWAPNRRWTPSHTLSAHPRGDRISKSRMKAVRPKERLGQRQSRREVGCGSGVGTHRRYSVRRISSNGMCCSPKCCVLQQGAIGRSISRIRCLSCYQKKDARSTHRQWRKVDGPNLHIWLMAIDAKANDNSANSQAPRMEVDAGVPDVPPCEAPSVAVAFGGPLEDEDGSVPVSCTDVLPLASVRFAMVGTGGLLANVVVRPTSTPSVLVLVRTFEIAPSSLLVPSPTTAAVCVDIEGTAVGRLSRTSLGSPTSKPSELHSSIVSASLNRGENVNNHRVRTKPDPASLHLAATHY